MVMTVPPVMKMMDWFAEDIVVVEMKHVLIVQDLMTCCLAIE